MRALTGRIAHGSVKKCAGEKCSYLIANVVESGWADGIDLRNHDNASTYSEQIADGEMLFGLRLDAFFGRDDKKDSIDATRACKHVADKELVPGHIDEAESQRTAGQAPTASREANPRSIVMPRRFSSGNRSVSIPVSAWTSAVLPWSICPAVPMTIDLTVLTMQERSSSVVSSSSLVLRRTCRLPQK